MTCGSRATRSIRNPARVWNVRRASAGVVEVANSSYWNAGQWYDIAYVYAAAGGKVAGKVQEYTDRAMELLQ